MSKARPIYPGAVLFTTRRTHKRQLLLRPSDEVNQAILTLHADLKLTEPCVSAPQDGHVRSDLRCAQLVAPTRSGSPTARRPSPSSRP